MSEGSSRDHAAHHPPAHAIDRLIEGLVTDLRPAPPLAAPLARALGWSTLVLAAGAVLALRADLGSLATRMAVPDLSLAALGSGLTAFAAAVAAFQTSVPGRGARWALLPLPPAALWIGASGLGCLRGWALPGMVPTTPEVMGTCLSFILIVSLPLSAFLMLMLRRACPLRPGLTAALGGLAAAAAAATLLVFFHPHDATALDLLVHLAVVGLVVVANGLLGGRLLEASR